MTRLGRLVRTKGIVVTLISCAVVAVSVPVSLAAVGATGGSGAAQPPQSVPQPYSTPASSTPETSSTVPPVTATDPAVTTSNPSVTTTAPSVTASGGPLTVAVSATPTSVTVGTVVTLTLTVENNSSSAVSAVSASTVLPDGMDWLTYSPNCQGMGPKFTCAFGATAGGIPMSTASLPAATSEQSTITVKVSYAASPLTVQVEASGSIPAGPVSASASTSIQVS
jgi:uncharacterized repeat protein (TIGR01451 family)